MNWGQVVAVAMLAGIGFTVALFITGLAFDGEELATLDTQARMGILVASLVASILGVFLLARSTPLPEETKPAPANQRPNPPTPDQGSDPGDGAGAAFFGGGGVGLASGS